MVGNFVKQVDKEDFATWEENMRQFKKPRDCDVSDFMRPEWEEWEAKCEWIRKVIKGHPQWSDEEVARRTLVTTRTVAWLRTNSDVTYRGCDR